MSDKPVPLDLTRHAHMIEGAREFLRMWVRPDGLTTCFVNPVPLGPDPAAFGAVTSRFLPIVRICGPSVGETGTKGATPRL